MADIDIAEQICLAVDEIVKKRLEDIKYDTTIVGTIVDNNKAKAHNYTCSNGSSTFIAYANDTTYKVGDSVQITIPNGDYNQQKIIIGKYVAKDNDTPYVYTPPLDTIIDISSNLINNKKTIYGALLANEDANMQNELFDKEVHLWTNGFDVPQIGFTRLGLAGQFRSWISSLEPISGDYGYRLEIFAENPELIKSNRVSIKDWIHLYNRVLNKEEVNDVVGLFDATPDEWYTNINFMGTPLTRQRFEEYFIDQNNRVQLIRLMLYTNTQITILKLERQDMYGDPFNYQSYFQQESVYDISSIGPIIGMSLFFYETSRSFYNKNEELMQYQNQFGDNFPPNLFTKDPYVCLGYDLAIFDKEQAILYTMDSNGYRFENEPNTEDNQELNKKTVRLRWLHKFENDEIRVINDDTELEGYEIRWYRYKLGSPSADEYSGVYWERVENNSNSLFEYTFIPYYKEVQEQIKAIVLYNGNIIRSNILTFNNELEVPNGATAELLAGLSIWCEDNSYGNYYLYGQNNDLIKLDDANRIRTFEARFADRELILSEADVDKTAVILTEGQKVIWEFPLNNSMIVVEGFNYNYLREVKEKYPDIKIDKNENLWYDIEQKDPNGEIYKLPGYYNNLDKENKPLEVIKVNNNIIKIIRYGEENQVKAHQNYRIEKTYSANKINNTVRCSVDKNGYTYSGSKDLSFGIMGTNGTDASLVIDFNNNITALTANAKESVKVSARLYDNNHNEVDFYNNDLNLECEWAWAYYHEFSKEQEVEIYNKALNDKEFLKSLFGDQEIDINNLSGAQKRKIHAEAMGRAGSVKIEPHNDNEPVNVCYLSHDTDLPMNENGLFLILQATVKGYGNYDLTAYKAIPIRKVRNYRHIIGPSEVIYNSAGYVDYYKGPYEIYHAETVNEYDMVPSGIEIIKKDNATWQIFDPYWDEEKPNKYIGNIPETNILQPASMYFEDVEPYGSICKIENQIVWIQPLVIMQNRYPSATINKWDGKFIEINENEGYILAPAIAAGKKHSDNSFSGVMIGDWSGPGADIGGTADEITKQTGVYGFNRGAMSYAFKEDGTAFIGKDGTGRIYLDGENARIYSATYEASNFGMMIDLGGRNESPYIDIKAPGSNILLKAEEGSSYMKFESNGSKIEIDSGGIGYPYIKIENNSKTSSILLSAEHEGSEIYFEGSGGSITISSSSSSYPLTIGDNFYVKWDGSLHANNAYLQNAYLQGEIEADKGKIGGWYITETTLQDAKEKANANIILDSLEGAICGGRLKPLNGNKMEVWGYFKICDSDGYSATENYIGYVTSGMEGYEGADGIGLGVNGAGAIKVTTVNTGLNFYPGDSYISLHKTGITIQAGANTPDKYLNLYGKNIIFDNGRFEVYGVEPGNQKGIYARFA